MAGRVVSQLLAVVVPPACVACRAPLARAELRLCSGCTRALPWLPPQGCRRCGLPAHRRGCPAAGAAFARAWAPMAYDGVARQLVAALKFRGALPVAALMAAHIAANVPADVRAVAHASSTVPPDSNTPADVRAASHVPRDSNIPADVRAAAHVPRDSNTPADVRAAAHASSNVPPDVGAVALVAVPPQVSRRRRRGFDPAGELTAALEARLGLTSCACLRRRDRESQLGATRAQRRRAGRLAIELRAPPPRRALLIDDVHTTGATLDACARALRAGGCEEVIAITYARTL